MYEVTVNRSGVVEKCDPEVVAAGENIANYILGEHWPTVALAIRETLDGPKGKWLCVKTRDGQAVQMAMRKAGGSVRIRAEFQSRIPAKILAALADSNQPDHHQVVLMDLTFETDPKVEYDSPDKAGSVAWSDEWLEDPMGMAPMIVPPLEKRGRS